MALGLYAIGILAVTLLSLYTPISVSIPLSIIIGAGVIAVTIDKKR